MRESGSQAAEPLPRAGSPALPIGSEGRAAACSQRRVTVQVLPASAAAPGELLGAASPVSPLSGPGAAECEGGTPLRAQNLSIYYANITALSQNAKAFIKDLPNHVVCLAETHVVEASSLRQFSSQIGRKVFQKTARPTVKHYSSGGEAILPLNHVSTAHVPQASVFPFAVSYIRFQKLTIMLGVFYARPGPDHPEAIEDFFSAIGSVAPTQAPPPF